jgi:hypothetical protein
MKLLLCILFGLICHAQSLPLRPNLQLTPGAIGSLDRAKVCQVGYSATVRKTSDTLKARVYRAYGLVNQAGLDFEIDHLVPLSLGGADTQKNLWPQSYLTMPWNAHVKDRLELYLHDQVCTKRTLTLLQAQRLFQNDWIKAYQVFLGQPATPPCGQTSSSGCPPRP